MCSVRQIWQGMPFSVCVSVFLCFLDGTIRCSALHLYYCFDGSLVLGFRLGLTSHDGFMALHSTEHENGSQGIRAVIWGFFFHGTGLYVEYGVNTATMIVILTSSRRVPHNHP